MRLVDVHTMQIVRTLPGADTAFLAFWHSNTVLTEIYGREGMIQRNVYIDKTLHQWDGL